MAPPPISALVLQEFRLRSESGVGEATRIVAAFAGGSQESIPLLVSIDDACDVATVRAVTTDEQTESDPRQRDRLRRLVLSWRPSAQYLPRIAERSVSPPSSYRLAVTGSGITDEEGDPSAAMPRDQPAAGSAIPFGLLWIGVPSGTHAGLLVLLGGYDDEEMRPDARVWPLPLSESLGVRIYESPRRRPS